MKKEIIKLITFKENEKISDVINTFNKTAKYTDSKGFGVVVNKSKQCVGTISDGDIRRNLNKNKKELTIKNIFNSRFVFVEKQFSNTLILRIFEDLINNQNYHLLIPVLDKQKKLIDIVSYNDFLLEKKKLKCIRVKVPARVSFVGGGTDFSEYLNKNKSYILSVAIQKYMTISIYPRKDEKIFINNFTMKQFKYFENIQKLKQFKKNDLVINLLKNKTYHKGFELEIFSDFAPKTGLGGSSILSLAILKALSLLKNEGEIENTSLINEAYKIERLESKIKGGWQDYLASISGGFNWIDLFQSEFIVNSLRIEKKIQLELENNLLLLEIGNRKDSSFIQKNKILAYKKNPKSKINKFKKIRELSINMKNSLIKGDLEKFGKLMDRSWELKKQLNPNSTNKKLDSIYTEAKKNGALGGKILGAGQAGYLLLYVNSSKQPILINKLIKKFSKLKYERLNFSLDGLKYWKIYK
ncbi:CBS domain-containing protein [Candidatus Pelagibacter sp.]|nr:CBS domain-containing protein [Candidatus Pelagibacter sp.]